jgi:Bacterial type II/III secretion system short domain
MPGLAPSAGFRGDAASCRGRLPNISVSPVRRSTASFLLVLALASTLSAQPQPPGPRDVVLRAYTFKYQRASEAVSMVYPLLSPLGTVELQPAGNTLVIRDTQAAIQRIVPVLRSFDHPVQPLRLEVFVVRASRAPAVSPQVQHSDLPDWLTKRLHDVLAYDIYELQAQAQLGGVEGQRVIYELGPEYRVSFRFGTLLEDQRVKLSNFRISRRAEGRPEANLLQTNLTLWLDQTMSLGLAKNEASREALMVVLTLRGGESAATGRRP